MSSAARRLVEDAHRRLATEYGAAVICLHRLGSSLSGQAAERAAEAARRSGDPLLTALAEAEVGLPLMHRGAYGPAEWITERARKSIADHRGPGRALDPRSPAPALRHPRRPTRRPVGLGRTSR